MFRKRRRGPYRSAPSGPRDWVPVEPWEEERKNSPWAILGVLGLILGVVASAVFLKPLFSGGDGGSRAGAVLREREGTRSPEPSPRPDPSELLAGNQLHTAGVALSTVTCELPDIGRSEERLREFYETAIGCLDDAWSPALLDAGFGWASPELELRARPGRCGEVPDEEDATAFYCGGTIYMPRTWVLDDLGVTEPAHLLVLAHEYGHHVQWQSRILRAASRREDALAGQRDEQLEVTRRKELQAECFAGLFVGSTSGRGSVESFADSIHYGQPSDEVSDTHGTSDHRRDWLTRGVRGEGRPAACNTWSAPAEQVG